MQKILKSYLLLGSMVCTCVAVKAEDSAFGIRKGTVQEKIEAIKRAENSKNQAASRQPQKQPPSYTRQARQPSPNKEVGSPPQLEPPSTQPSEQLPSSVDQSYQPPLDKIAATQPQSKPPSKKYEPVLEQRDMLEEMKERERKTNIGYEERDKERKKGRKLQKFSADMDETVSDVMGKVSALPKMAAFAGAMTGDPHAKLARWGLQFTLLAIEGLAKVPSRIILAVGRYKERSQQFLTINEILIIETMDSIAAYDKLKKKEKQYLLGNKDISSRIERKIDNATDALYLTDVKGERGKKLQELRETIEKAKERAENNILTLQIKLLQDNIKYIDRVIHRDEIIYGFKEDLQDKGMFKRSGLQETLDGLIRQKAALEKELSTEKPNSKIKSRVKNLLTRKPDSKIKDQVTEIGQKIQNIKAEIDLLKSNTQSKDELEADKEKLITEINRIEPHTAIGKAQYMQKKGLDPNNLLSKDAVIGLHKELDAFKEALCSSATKTPEIQNFCSKK